MAKMKLNPVEMAGIRTLFKDGKSLDNIQEIMPKNKVNVVADFVAELELEEDVVLDWGDVFRDCQARLEKSGIPGGDAALMIERAKKDLDLSEHEPDAEKLYIHCVSSYSGNAIINKSDSGRDNVHAMTGAAAANPMPRAHTNMPRNVCRPNPNGKTV